MRTPRELYLIRRFGRLATDMAIVFLIIGAYGLVHNDEPVVAARPATTQPK